MFKLFYVRENERGILYERDDFQRILQPGVYRYWWGSKANVITFDLNEPEAELNHLELLLQNHRAELEAHLTIVQTNDEEAALVRLGKAWITIGPNQLRAFWRGFIPVDVHRFNLTENFELPTEFLLPLRGLVLNGIKSISLSEAQIGLLYRDNNFIRPLEPGDYAFWVFGHGVAVSVLNRLEPQVNLPTPEVLVERHPEFVASYCQNVQLGANEVAIARYKGKAIALLPPHSRQLFWQEVTLETVAIDRDPKLPPRLVAELVSGLPEVRQLGQKFLHLLDVPPQHSGLLYLDGELQPPLSPGVHAWWIFGRSFKSEAVDLRLQTLEIAGQEILSKDKVPLRLNLTASYRVVDPVRAKENLANIEAFLYKELQFGLRSAVGTRSLDGLLEDKGAIDRSVADYIAEKVADSGLQIDSVGVKDIILPGEIKTILSKVVEAEKAAQANVVRRREETAATRSMLNTAKVMEDNPVALRLKELEILERIAEKIQHINVNGSLDSILTELIRMDRQ